MPRCAAMLQTHFLDARSHTRTSPSQAPDINCTRLLCGDAEHQTPSVCPSRAPTNGFAKTRSSFVALRARRYSRACAKGCTSAEAFLGRTFTSVASSRVHFFSERASALNFMEEKSELYGSDGRLRPAHRAILGTLRGAPCDVRLAEGEHWGGRSDEWVQVDTPKMRQHPK